MVARKFKLNSQVIFWDNENCFIADSLCKVFFQLNLVLLYYFEKTMANQTGKKEKLENLTSNMDNINGNF